MQRLLKFSTLDKVLIGACAMTLAGIGVKDVRRRFFPQRHPGNGKAAYTSSVQDDAELLAAAAAGDRDRALALLQRGASVDATDERFARTPFMIAAESGHTALVRALGARAAEQVAAVDRHGMGALELAAWRGHAETVAALLDLGAAPGVLDAYGVSALHKAAAHGHADVCRVLLARDAALALQPIGESRSVPGQYSNSLHLAAAKGHATVVEVLLETARDVLSVDETDDQGCTALHHGSGDFAVVDVLLAHGADPHALCHGKTAAQMSEHLAARLALQRAMNRTAPASGATATEGVGAGASGSGHVSVHGKQSADDVGKDTTDTGAKNELSTAYTHKVIREGGFKQ